MATEFDLNKILQIAVKGGASDIHIKAGLPPIYRMDGALVPLGDAKRLSPEDIGRMAASIMNKFQKVDFEENLDLDMSYGVPGVGRFRVNIFQQRGSIGLVFRVIPFKVRTLDELELPAIVKSIAEERRGLVLVTGATGSGKSTTLASMVDFINSNRTDHIITIEDPIEYLIRDKKSIINQREVGHDTRDFSRAVRAALRQDPDVIMLGEMRDLETIEIAMTAAETGHLVLTTLHTTDAAESVNRIITAFPPHQRDHARYQFANLFKGVVAQRLVPRADGKGRVPAVEVMLATGRIQEMILEGATTRSITEQISKGVDNYGMQTFDQSLMILLQNGLITYEEALSQSSNPDDFALRVSGIGSTSADSSWKNFERSSGASPSGSDDDFNLDEFDIERF
ncbi:type IV pilus twitching motility protein PilT [Bradymonas sediminis]|uniref:Type IV pili twitching motility protein PilT n=1 Tax=Bradymonas sediminis TaxID=1548548 RepID=A0A2Z4FJB5_9DELT|nr:type IV pilus twitching motility protein PilT [Bradymonas sediminis]AWV89019.1 type IV pili twitching motility protein PilT [Bradymonas sediminis]TDP64522.1 twitching motility protein PilT [Bradymonas sediminis]